MATLTRDLYPIPDPSLAGRMLEREAILILTAQAQVKVLNDVGARLWVLADGTRSLGELATTICQEYQVDLDQADKDITEFFELLVSKGMYTVAAAPAIRNG